MNVRSKPFEFALIISIKTKKEFALITVVVVVSKRVSVIHKQLTMAPSFTNGGSSVDTVVPPSVTGRFASVYSEVQNSRIFHTLPLPSVLKTHFKIIDGPLSSAAGNPGISLPPSSNNFQFLVNFPISL